MKKTILLAVLVLSVLTVRSHAATLTDNFDNGINAYYWETFQTDAAGAPWSISTSTGVLEISKSSDNDAATTCVAGVSSKFRLDGNFTISVDFDCVNFPLPSYDGWNEALLTVSTDNGTVVFHSLKEAKGPLPMDGPGYCTEGFTNLRGDGLVTVADSTLIGKLGLTRNGNTIFNWIDRGDGQGTIVISTWSSDRYLGLASISLWANQQIILSDRPHTALDVRFDNFTITADSIIGVPEPCSIALLSLGGLILRRRKKSK